MALRAVRFWHTDNDFTTQPMVTTFLNGKEIPDVGGHTMFANIYMAYEALSSTMKGHRTVVSDS